MSRLDELINSDISNIEESKRVLTSIYPDSLLLVEKFIDFFNDIANEWGKECDLNVQQKIINDWTQGLNFFDKKILEYLRSATLIGPDPKNDNTKNAKSALERGQTIIARLVLLLQLQRDFLFGISDLLRFRISSSKGYIRIQSETVGLLKLMATNSEIAQEWFTTYRNNDGKKFYKKWQTEIKQAIREFKLEWYYDHGSESAFHTRINGIAAGILIGNKDKQPGTYKLIYQEVDEPGSLFFWFGSYLRFHRKIIENFGKLLPEIEAKITCVKNLNELFALENICWEISAKHAKKTKKQNIY